MIEALKNIRNKWQTERLSTPVFLLLLLVFVFLLTMYAGSMNVSSAQPPLSAAAQKRRALLIRYAQKCKGSFSKLSAHDQQIVNRMCGKEWSSMAIQTLYKNPKATQPE